MRKLTQEQAAAEYRKYCDMLQLGTNPVTFNEFLVNFSIQVI